MKPNDKIIKDLKFKKGLFGKKPDGWKDLGSQHHEFGDIYQYHNVCGRAVNIGKVNNQLFWFCGHCEVFLKWK